MIVSTHEDIVRLSGALDKNHWLTIKAAAYDLLGDHPQGIIIDCAELSRVSEAGAKTFLEAMKDIEAAGARIIVCNLPDNVQQVIRSVPGVRSQLPIANSIEEARASFRLSETAPSANEQSQGHGIVIPLLRDIDADHAVNIAARIAREQRVPLHLVYLLVVGRNLPLGAPLANEEETAQRLLDQAIQAARKLNVPHEGHVERVRDAGEGVLQAIKNYRAAHVVLSGYAEHDEENRFHILVEALLHRAPCNVLIARRAIDAPLGEPV